MLMYTRSASPRVFCKGAKVLPATKEKKVVRYGEQISWEEVSLRWSPEDEAQPAPADERNRREDLIVADVRAEWLDTVRRWKPDPDPPATDEYWSPKLETISRDELGAIQGEKLVKAVAYMFECSRLFRRKCEE